jgi:hypothetical protein
MTPFQDFEFVPVFISNKDDRLHGKNNFESTFVQFPSIELLLLYNNFQ